MMMIDKLEKAWGSFNDEMLIKQNIYIHSHPTVNEEQIDLLNKLLRPRNLPVYSHEKIMAERKKAMQIHYTKDSEYQQRMKDTLYQTVTCDKCGKPTYRHHSCICEECEAEFLEHIVLELVNMGFCQQKFYKPTAWKYAMKMMDLAMYMQLVKACDMGRGKGKFMSNQSTSRVAEIMQDDYRAVAIAREYYKYKLK